MQQNYLGYRILNNSLNQMRQTHCPKFTLEPYEQNYRTIWVFCWHMLNTTNQLYKRNTKLKMPHKLLVMTLKIITW